MGYDFISSYHIDYSSVCYLGSGEMLVVGSENRILSARTFKSFVRLVNTSGSIIKNRK